MLNFTKKNSPRFTSSRVSLRSFYDLDLDKVYKTLQNKPSDFWEREGEKLALALFKKASRDVPAYKDFLRKAKVNPDSIKSISDFKKLPTTDKQNYLRQYPLEKLCWNGDMTGSSLLSVSSGSSGRPFFWPRGDALEMETSLIHALILKYFFGADKSPTLFIDTFSMGIYIAGVITLNSVLRTSQLGLPITIITPGIELEDIFRVIEEIGSTYKQIVIAGYPPFTKDIIDSGAKRGIDWKRYNIKFLFATENFSEGFRDYMSKRSGNPHAASSSINIYGSADAGILGHETPLSISIRRAASKNNRVARELFGESTFSPTFAQYHPRYKFFEEVGSELTFSCYGGIPLIRYNTHDAGKVLKFNSVTSLPGLKSRRDIRERLETSWKLPFVAVFGKSDMTISFYGLKIYPENIGAGLESETVLPLVTGKFTMESKTESDQRHYWEINVELRDDVGESQKAKRIISDSIISSLREKNLEYNRLHMALGKKALPIINIFKKGDDRYINRSSVKHRWIKKS